jgi:hypothetical protein
MTAEVQANRITKLKINAGIGWEQYSVYRMYGIEQFHHRIARVPPRHRAMLDLTC